ncbi:hypothetical protein ADUPG1_002655, partial [Aduncisulcus paluster]
ETPILRQHNNTGPLHEHFHIGDGIMAEQQQRAREYEENYGKIIMSWLEELNLVQYHSVFITHQIDEESVHSLNEDDLKEMGILKIGHRKIFLRNLKHLTKRFDDISSKDILPGDEHDSPELRTDEILSGSIVAEDHTPVRESTTTLVPVRLGNAQRTIKKRITTEKERREKINTDS